MTGGEFTYPDVGATRRPGPLPAGYDHVRMRGKAGTGSEVFATVAEALMTWNIHRGTGLHVEVAAERAAVGVRVISSVGAGPIRLRIPCQVVWVLNEPTRAGFAYGTLPRHPASGEESFVVEIDEDDDVWFTVTAFSRPARWYTKLGGPIARSAQRVATRRYIATALQLADGSDSG